MKSPDRDAADELLPCPFCGPGQSICEPWFDDMAQRWRVGCGRCGASSGTNKDKGAVIASWNCRPDASELATLRRRMEEMRKLLEQASIALVFEHWDIQRGAYDRRELAADINAALASPLPPGRNEG